MDNKVYVITDTMKNAREYFNKGEQFLQGWYNEKPAVLISYGYWDYDIYEVHSASPSGRYLGTFVPEKFVSIDKARGKVLICK